VDSESQSPLTNSDKEDRKDEFLDAIKRHICQVLGFDYVFIDFASGSEISKIMEFSGNEADSVARKFVDTLLDEHKSPISQANSLVAQTVRNTNTAWIGKAFTKDDLARGSQGVPYAMIPVLDTFSAGNKVRGIIRVVCFDSTREIELQDISTLKLLGEQMASRPGFFGETHGELALAETPKNDALDRDVVLIIHPDRVARRRFNRILSGVYNLHELDSTSKAMAHLNTERVDVVLLDSGSKGESNLQFCQLLKKNESWEHIPIIIVSNDNSPSARVEGLNAGADDCLNESCLETELVARINTALRHRKVERELSVQLNLLEDYAQRLEKAHEQLDRDRQTQIQKSHLLEQLMRESDVLRHQDNLLHRISNNIRQSFAISDNLSQMLEDLAGFFSLDNCFVVLPAEHNEDEQEEDAIRVETVTDKAYKIIDYDKDLECFKVFKDKFPSDQPIISNDVMNDRRLEPFRKSLALFPVQSLFYIPITYEKKPLGLLVGYRCETRAAWSRINETFMKSVADQVANGVVNARLYAKIQRQATTDGLTRLFNHRTGQEKLAEQLKIAERYQRNLSIIMLDVDHFKSINDRFGHPAGDTVLKAVAHLIHANCRDVDIPVRYGGEEFLLVLPEVNQDGAVVVAERIRKALVDTVVSHEALKITISGSFGVAAFPEDADQQQQLLDLADKSLYLSKRLGRNQVHTASDLMFAPGEEKEEQPSTREVAVHVKEHSDVGDFMVPAISAQAMTQDELVPEVVDMVKSLASTLYSKSEYNKVHHLEVARMSELLAKVMGLTAQQVEQIRVAGLLHDVGLLKLKQELLDKPGMLSLEERELVNQHAVLGADLLRPVRALREICNVIESHHERWDGTGYPKGLVGENIPLASRIISIVDAYHAMISDRPYRDALSMEEAMEALKAGAGKQWDPFLLEIFSAVQKSVQEGKAGSNPTPVVMNVSPDAENYSDVSVEEHITGPLEKIEHSKQLDQSDQSDESDESASEIHETHDIQDSIENPMMNPMMDPMQDTLHESMHGAESYGDPLHEPLHESLRDSLMDRFGDIDQNATLPPSTVSTPKSSVLNSVLGPAAIRGPGLAVPDASTPNQASIKTDEVPIVKEEIPEGMPPRTVEQAPPAPVQAPPPPVSGSGLGLGFRPITLDEDESLSSGNWNPITIPRMDSPLMQPLIEPDQTQSSANSAQSAESANVPWQAPTHDLSGQGQEAEDEDSENEDGFL